MKQIMKDIKFRNKKQGCIVILTFLLFINLIFSVNAEVFVNLMIDGEIVTFDKSLGAPFADDNNRTQVPLRATMEKINAEVYWSQENQKAIISKNEIIVEVYVGKSYISINGNKKEIDTVPVVKEERIYLPIRFVIEAFEGEVAWNQANMTVEIESKEYIKSKENISDENLEETIIDENAENIPDDNEKQNTENIEVEELESENLEKVITEETKAGDTQVSDEKDSEEKIEEAERAKDDSLTSEEDTNENVQDVEKVDETEEIATENATVNGTYVNVRKEASITSEVLFQVEDNERLVITYKKGKWYELDYKGTTCYIYDLYVILDEGTEIEKEAFEGVEMPTVDNLYTEWALKYFYTKTLGTDSLNQEIYDISVAHGLDPVFVKCLMILESGGQVNITSKPNSKGVYYVGLMQVASNYGFDNERILSDAKYAIECGIEIINRKILAAKNKGNTPTIHEIAWRYNSYNEAGKPYAEKVSKLYEELTGKSRYELVTLE